MRGHTPGRETTAPAPDLPLLWAWAVLVMSVRDCDITEWRWSEKGSLGPPPGELTPGPDKMEDPEKNRAGNSPEMGTGRGARS